MNVPSARTYFIFLSSYGSALKNRVAALSFYDEVKSAFFVFVGGLFAFALFAFFLRLTVYFDSVPMIGPGLAGKFFSLICLSMWWMVVFSALNAAYAHLYFSDDTDFLLSSPISSSEFFVIKIWKIFRDSSSTAAVAAVPLVAAFGFARGADFSYYAQSFAGLVPFFMSASAVGALAVALISRVLPATRSRRLVFALAAAAGTAFYVLVRLIEPERLARPDSLERVAEYLAFLGTPAAEYLPSGWYYAVCAVSSLGGFSVGAWAALALVCAAGIGAALVALKLFYLDALALKDDFKNVGVLSARGPVSPIAVIAASDAKIFFREPQRWTQIILVAGLFAVYLVSMAKIPAETAYIKMFVAFLNVGLSGFIVCALSLRFVFAAMSEESKTWWILASSPVPKEKIIRAKMLTRFFLSVLAPAAASAVSSAILGAPPAVFASSVIAVAGLGGALASSALYFGVRFPVRIFSSVAEIEGSSGGLFYVAASLFYIALNMSFMAAPFRSYYVSMISGVSGGLSPAAVSSALFVFNAALAFIFYKKAVGLAAVYE